MIEKNSENEVMFVAICMVSNPVDKQCVINIKGIVYE